MARLPKYRLPRIRGTQIGLSNPAQVDQMKADMLAGRFAYHEVRAQVVGLKDRRGTLYVRVGHHRIVAALEILSETGNHVPIQTLIELGNWHPIEYSPNDSEPLPTRSWWGRLRTWCKSNL